MPLIEDIIVTTNRDYENWKSQARVYGTISSILSPLLIISTALVAAEQTLNPYISLRWQVVFPALSVIVAIITALNAWLKPREKWRGFLADRDAAEILLMQEHAVDRNDSAKIEALLEELRLLQKHHVEKNVY